MIRDHTANLRLHRPGRNGSQRTLVVCVFGCFDLDDLPCFQCRRLPRTGAGALNPGSGDSDPVVAWWRGHCEDLGSYDDRVGGAAEDREAGEVPAAGWVLAHEAV